MGIRQYGQRWRLAISVDGKMKQLYFDNEAAAIAEEVKIKGARKGCSMRKFKRKTADQGLPTGFCDSGFEKPLRSGKLANYRQITLSMTIDKVPRKFSRSYGHNRTREEAIELLKIVEAQQFQKMNDAPQQAL